MELIRKFSVLAVCVGLAACVTINVYFPAAEARDEPGDPSPKGVKIGL